MCEYIKIHCITIKKFRDKKEFKYENWIKTEVVSDEWINSDKCIK